MAMDFKTKTLDNSKYDSFSKEDLIAKIIQYENASVSLQENKLTRKRKRPFQWLNVPKRHILLKFVYFGWEYKGYATQTDTTNTVEEHLITALKTACFIENRESSNYHRCGRTDTGVSAFSQVISIDVRSKLKDPDNENTEEEFQYCKILNRILPIYIRCYAWCHIASEVSARFDCTSRSYSYFFPRGNLDISSMIKGAKHLEGTHDFRNLCKMDVGNGVVEFVRTINTVSITLHKADQLPEFEIMKFFINSRGFLWHQIRFIMAVLFLIGEGNESHSIIEDLLDISKYPCKPQYHMGIPLPLSLSDALYENHNLKWIVSNDEINYLSGQLQELWTEFAVKECMVKEALNLVKSLVPQEIPWQAQQFLYNGVASKFHIPFSKRPTCSSLEDRILHTQKKKMKLNEKVEQDKKLKGEEDKKPKEEQNKNLNT